MKKERNSTNFTVADTMNFLLALSSDNDQEVEDKNKVDKIVHLHSNLGWVGWKAESEANPLEMWKVNEEKYPKLSTLAS